MATKTISVDLEAYERLRRARAFERESFSQVIKRATWEPLDGTAASLLAWIRARDAEGTETQGQGLSDEALDRLDRWQEADAVAPDRWADANVRSRSAVKRKKRPSKQP